MVPSLATLCHAHIIDREVNLDPHLDLTEYLDIFVGICRSRSVQLFAHDDLIIGQAIDAYWEMAELRHEEMSLPWCPCPQGSRCADSRLEEAPWAFGIAREGVAGVRARHRREVELGLRARKRRRLN